MEEPKKKRWNWTLILCVVLLGLNLWQGKRLSELEQGIRSVQNSVVNQVSQVSGQVSSLRYDMEHAEDVVLDWDYTTSVKGIWLLVDVSVTLKEWQADTVAELLWTNGNGSGGEGYVPLVHNSVGTFTGTLELPLSELSGGFTEFTLDVKIVNGEAQRRESLGYLGEAAELLPLQCYGWGVGGPDYTRDADKNGVLTVSSCEAELRGRNGSLPELSGQVFRLRRNGEIAAEETAMFGNSIEQYTCQELSSRAQIGDRIILTFFCRDENGLGYEFFLNGWEMDDTGITEAAPETDWPRLTWD